MIANYHTHTKRCGHAFVDEREVVESAVKQGWKVIGFSEHVPFIAPSGRQFEGAHMPVETLDDYFQTLTALQKEYQGKIEIPIGFECEYYPDIHEETLKRFEGYPLDYLILGQHTLDSEYQHSCFEASDDLGRFKEYASLLTEGMRTGRYSYVAHPDVYQFTGSDADFERVMGDICELAAEINLPLEYNLLGKNGNRHYPSDRMARLATECGASLILGADIHYDWQMQDQTEMIAESTRHLVEDLGATLVDTVTLKKPI